MARRYFLTDLTSDLSGGAQNEYILPAPNSTGTLSETVASLATDTIFTFTPALHPNQVGALTGTYTQIINVTTANSNLRLSVRLHRINSTGTIQTSGTASAEQTPNPTGTYTFTFTSISLGTWTATDRLRVDFIIRNTAHSNQTMAIGFSNTYITTPFNARYFNIT
jgi:hypothetical protein